eukprot:CAMPEP_0183548990 /NCGR_PEP_ID=MMETSP0371-20130417/62053_1 /TAXON_ID=268820 /ORGANISM="Peridinium aciculiferum, Strain PAER-2" /LENGTH=55 /DNA_ID=CAMNT_0025752555 /DNA_START=47 /DNA_END=211 /DNA_ORIENTATION=+
MTANPIGEGRMLSKNDFCGTGGADFSRWVNCSSLSLSLSLSLSMPSSDFSPPPIA